jgi:hypothetical protein
LRFEPGPCMTDARCSVRRAYYLANIVHDAPGSRPLKARKGDYPIVNPGRK